MSGKDDERKPSFADALGDVTPLAGRDKIAPRPKASATPNPQAEAAATREFIVERDGDWIGGRAADVSVRPRAELRAGRIPVDREVDLHGFNPDAAHQRLRQEFQDARGSGARCLRVIHGWGRGSLEGPVLKQALPDWLQSAPLAADVLAFATAPRAQGGVGATLVWLRRVRRR